MGWDGYPYLTTQNVAPFYKRGDGSLICFKKVGWAPISIYHTRAYYTFLFYLHYTIQYEIIVSSLLRGWGQHSISFYKLDLASLSTIHYTILFFAKVDLARPSSFKRVSAAFPFHHMMITYILFRKMEVASPALTRRWVKHIHLNILYYLILCYTILCWFFRSYRRHTYLL